MSLKLNLDKSAAKLRLDLSKKGLDPSKLKSQVIIDLDVSGSFENEHKQGLTARLITRLVPWALVLDVNGEIDLFTFADGPENAHHVGTVDADNCETFVRDHVIDKVPGWRGGTHYSHVLEKNLQLFGWIPESRAISPAPQIKKPGFLERLFGGAQSANPQPAVSATPKKKERSLVAFITDGANNDQDRTRQILRDSQKRGDDVYFLFIGFSGGGGKFDFLKQIADEFDNTGLVIINNLDEFTTRTDEELNELFLGDELVTWFQKAQLAA